MTKHSLHHLSTSLKNKVLPNPAFTLVELIVVITILAILATVGFLSLSGYSDDARTATVKANVRTVYSAILTESTTSGNSPRYYVDHGTGAALSWAFVFVDGKQVALTGGNVGEVPTDSNYTAGNPRWDRLRMNGEKFRLSSGRAGCAAGGAYGGTGIPVSGPCDGAKSPKVGNSPSATGLPYALGGFGSAEIAGFAGPAPDANAAYSTGELAVGAVDIFKTGANGRKRATPYFQVAGVVPGSKAAVVNGNFAGGTAGGLIRDPGATGSVRTLSDGIPSASAAFGDCKAAKEAFPGSGDGAYWIDPDGVGGNPEFKALCDMTTDGGGWTVFQERFDGSVDFYLGWSSYVAGFGNPGSGEHWLGLERIRTLTATPRSLYVAMARNTGETAYAKYSSFAIGDASTNYVLNVSGYEGTAGDSMLYYGQNGRPFSTFDSDNDTWGNNCAVVFQGAWWYSDCHFSNLNGKYYGGAHASFADGMDWRGWLGYYESVTKSRMMVR